MKIGIDINVYTLYFCIVQNKQTKNQIMEYSTEQIETAKREYGRFLQTRSASFYEVEEIGMSEAQRRADEHNSIVNAINSGNVELRREWKMFFLNSAVKSANKELERKEKQDANMKNSADVLQPLRDAKKITSFYKWIDTCGNPYRKQHYSKKYTVEAVNSFFASLS